MQARSSASSAARRRRRRRARCDRAAMRTTRRSVRPASVRAPPQQWLVRAPVSPKTQTVSPLTTIRDNENLVVIFLRFSSGSRTPPPTAAPTPVPTPQPTPKPTPPHLPRLTLEKPTNVSFPLPIDTIDANQPIFMYQVPTPRPTPLTSAGGIKSFQPTPLPTPKPTPLPS